MRRSALHWGFGAAALIAGYCVHWLDISLVGKIAPAIAASFSQPVQSMSLPLLASRIGLALGAMIGGAAGDRWGRRRLLCICLGLAALGSFAATWVTGFGWFAVLRGLSGVFLGGAAPCALALVTNVAPDKWRPVLLTATLAGASVGSSLASLVTYSLGEAQDWRIGFWICSALLTLALVMARGWLPAPQQADQRRHRLGIGALVGPWRRATLLLGAGFLLSMGLNAMLASWMPSYFLALAEIPVQRFAGIAMFTTPLAVLGMLAPGWLARRFALSGLFALFVGLHSVSLWLLGSLAFGGADFIGALALLACVQAAEHSLLNLCVVASFPAALFGSALGLVAAAGRVGGILATAAGAWVLSVHPSIQTLFALLSTVPLLVGALVLLLKRFPSAGGYSSPA